MYHHRYRSHYNGCEFLYDINDVTDEDFVVMEIIEDEIERYKFSMLNINI